MQNYFVSFAVATVVACFTPGMNNITSMSLARQYGFKKTLPYITGVAIGWLSILMLCNLINSFLTRILPNIQLPLRVLGALYMLFLAYKVLTSKPGSGEAGKAWQTSVWAGIAVQYINPKGILFALSMSVSTIVPHSKDIFQMLLHSLFMVAVAACSGLSWAGCGAAFSRVFKQHATLVNVIMALLLVYCAVMLSGLV